ncbi:hypothetical protein [Pseudarthrobacter sulfonivorans]|uniref:phosphoribosyltransferase-like protein n=1 Tax=Pseudarthrobacter sulfonivorans TaxID=121292 RepID=UPI0028637375|nr:hypothetical protein [Pseudarthrobacter sulfonivorans]MDR6417723.1 hypothetical protein [Pseudarthrobacter sulfonivorans]
MSRIRVLSDQVWEQTVQTPDIERWLSNFDGKVASVKEEHLHALHLLSHFNYFGSREIRELLKAVFRDLYRYPIIQSLRTANGGSRDSKLLNLLFQQELGATRFLGMGNPSESGSHLLYYFRQENQLSKRLFIHQHEILDRAPGSPDARLAIPGLKRLVFIDDLLGSGSQATQYSQKLLQFVRAAAQAENRDLEICYFTLFAKAEGLALSRNLAGFDRVNAVHEMDATESAFHAHSRVYASASNTLSQDDGREIAARYGELVSPGDGLGFGNGQLLLGMHHNIPDNTLPIFWRDDSATQWTPIFPRYNKVY